MSDIQLIEVEDQGEKTIAAFYKRMAAELGEPHHEVLNQLARALTERGWVQPVDAVVKKLAELSSVDRVTEALVELQRRRLVYVDDAGERFTGILGSISVTKTDHRGHLESGVDVYTYGGLDLLALPSMFLKSVDAFTKCANSGKVIQLKIDREQIVDSNTPELCGFKASWDGKSSLIELAKRSPLFASDADLEAWQEKNPGVDGMALPADLMLWVGMGAAQELGGARFKLVGHDG